MAEGPDADNYLKTVLLAKLDEMVQVFVAGPVEFSFRLFVDVPEHIGGDNADAGSFDLLERLVPLGARRANVVKFAHQRNDGGAVLLHVEVVEGDRVAARIFSAELQLI